MPKEVGPMIIAGIPVMVTLGFRLGIAYLKFKRKAKKAARVFERELIAGGLDRESAESLTEMYLSSSRIVRMGLKGAMKGGPRSWRERAASGRR